MRSHKGGRYYERFMRRCSVPGCGQKHLAKGLCAGHYAHFRTGGAFDALPPVAGLLHHVCERADCFNRIIHAGYCEHHGGKPRGKGGKLEA